MYISHKENLLKKAYYMNSALETCGDDMTLHLNNLFIKSLFFNKLTLIDFLSVHVKVHFEVELITELSYCLLYVILWD